MHAARNTQQALDWASKRKLQVERAARLRAERQALLKADRVNADNFDLTENDDASHNHLPPLAGRRAQTSHETMHASHEAGAIGGSGLAEQSRPQSEQPMGRYGRRAMLASPSIDGEAQQRPEWARDMGSGARPSRFVDGAEGIAHDHGADLGVGARSSHRLVQPDSWDTFRVDARSVGAHIPDAEWRGGATRFGATPTATSEKHEAAVAAAAARFPDDIPLTQSDGAIGFSRQRLLPRGGFSEQPQPLNAADFFGLEPRKEARREAVPAAIDPAAAFFGYEADFPLPDQPKTTETRRHGRPRNAASAPPSSSYDQSMSGAPSPGISGDTAAEALRLLPRRSSIHRMGGAARRPELNVDTTVHEREQENVYHDDSAGDSEISVAPTTAAADAIAAPLSAQRATRGSRAPTFQQPEWNSDFTGANTLLSQPPPPVPRRPSAGRRRVSAAEANATGEFARPLEEVVAPRRTATRGRRAEAKPEWDPTPATDSYEDNELAGGGGGGRDGSRRPPTGDRRPGSSTRRVPSASRRSTQQLQSQQRYDGGPGAEWDESGFRDDRNERPIGVSRDERPVGGGRRDERPVGGGGRDERPVGGVSRDEQFLGGGGGRDERPLPKAPASVPVGEDEAPTVLCECDICGRKFAESRIDKHRVACEKSKSKVRKVFNGAKQRLQGLDNVNVKAGEKEALKAAERRKELMRSNNTHASTGAGSGAPYGFGGKYGECEEEPVPPPAQVRKSRVMLGKDGRPLSPLSAAVARAKAGEDPFDEDPALRPSSITPCPCCGRNFAADRLEVHLAICQKVTVNSQSRKVWDSSRQRLQGGNSDFGSSPMPARPLGTRKSFPRGPPRVPSASRAGAGDRAARHGGSGGSGEALRPGGSTHEGASMPANRMPKWKRDHAAFQAALKAGRQLKAAQEAGIPLSSLPPPPSIPDHDDRTACPHCGRRFNQQAAERHIPKCTSIAAKPKMLTRGGGIGIHNAHPSRSSVRF